jgi:hypothetical protein
MRCWVGLLCLGNMKDECGSLLFKVSTIFTYMEGYQWRIWYLQNMDTFQFFECLNQVKTIWHNRVRLRDYVAFIMLNLYQVNNHYVVGMNTYVCHQGFKHGWFVWMVGSTDVRHWIVDASMKNNAEDTMKARLFFCGLKIITYDFNIYISYCSFSNTNTFCMM